MNRVHFGTLTNQTLEFKLISCPKLFKDLHATLGGYTRIKPIKRTRKRQIEKAKHMMAWHDQRVMSGHSGGSKALENRRGGVSEAITVMHRDYLCNSNYHHGDCLQG